MAIDSHKCQIYKFNFASLHLIHHAQQQWTSCKDFFLQTEHLCGLIHIRIKDEVVAVKLV